MASEGLTREERQRILKTLEEDREFRYVVMGLLGYKEVLERSARLEERMVKLEERMLRLEERQQKLEERFIELAERQQKLEERMVKLEERMLKAEAELVTLRKTLEYTRRDMGALTETVYSRMVWEDLREEISARGEKVIRRARNARINGYDIDLIVETDSKVYIVEVKIQPNHHDVDELLRKAGAVEKASGKPVEAILAGTWIGGELRRYCENRKVRVLEY